MAKKCMVAREKRRILAAGRHYATRCALRRATKDVNLTAAERWEAVIKLQKRPRDESLCRVRHCCKICGRPRAVLRRFGMCRACIEINWKLKYIPGLLKSSW